jgi:hypothetical protein
VFPWNVTTSGLALVADEASPAGDGRVGRDVREDEDARDCGAFSRRIRRIAV